RSGEAELVCAVHVSRSFWSQGNGRSRRANDARPASAPATSNLMDRRMVSAPQGRRRSGGAEVEDVAAEGRHVQIEAAAREVIPLAPVLGLAQEIDEREALAPEAGQVEGHVALRLRGTVVRDGEQALFARHPGRDDELIVGAVARPGGAAGQKAPVALDLGALQT